MIGLGRLSVANGRETLFVHHVANKMGFCVAFPLSNHCCLPIEALRGSLFVKQNVTVRQFATSLLLLVHRLEAVFGLYHGDIKPSNLVFVSTEADRTASSSSSVVYSPRFIDMDLAHEDRFHYTAAGTVGFMAPEVAHEFKKNSSNELDALACDLYSCGVTIRQYAKVSLLC